MTNQKELKSIFESWDERDISILAILCDLDEDTTSVTAITEQIRWLYNSRARHRIKRNFKRVVRQHASEDMPCPSYEVLLAGAAKKLGIHKHCTSTDDYERYIPQAVIVAALARMNPPQRDRFFTEKFNATPMWEAAGV